MPDAKPDSLLPLVILSNPDTAGGWHGNLSGIFDVLGVSPALGRVFAAAHDRTDSPDAVISYSYWQHWFGGRPDVLGMTFTLRKAGATAISATPTGT